MEIINDKIVMKTSEDAILKFDEGNYYVDHYIPPYGTNQINEVSDLTYRLGNHYVPYHFHDRGVETLMVLKGRVEVTLNGKRCVCEEGDFINIPAHCPHGMVLIDEGCALRAMYADVNMIADCRDRKLLARNALQHKYNTDLMEHEYGSEHHYFELTAPVDVEWAEKDSLPQITSKGKAIYEYDGWEGINCQLKIGRWNMKNLKEVWEFKIDKNYQMQYFKPTPKEGVYVVKSGRLMLEVDGRVLFPEKDDIIHIPQYTPYTLTALTEDSVVYDYNVNSRLFRMLEMLALAQRDEPEKAADPEWMKWLLDLNDCSLTGFIKTETTIDYGRSDKKKGD